MSQSNFAIGATPVSLVDAGSQASTVTGSAVDLAGYEGNMLIVQAHGAGTGTLDGKIQDSANGTTGWADVTGATFTQSTTTADVQSISINHRTIKRYIRYVGTIVTGPHELAVTFHGMKKYI